MKKIAFVLLLQSLLCLSACNNGGNQQSQEPEEKPINVFILSGQSNMEGNTQFDDGHGYLQEGLDELKKDALEIVRDVENYEGGFDEDDENSN